MDNLRTLVYSNPLVVDKISKRFLYFKDSGFIFTRNLLATFPSSWRVDWVVPEKLAGDPAFEEWARTYVQAPVYFIPYPYSTSIHQNRYEFYGEVFRKRFPYATDVDVIINNQPEVSANLRVWAFNQRRDRPLIYSFYHWLDCEESRTFSQELGGYFWRQYDGALHSDAVYLHHPYGKNLFVKELESRGLSWVNLDIRGYTPPATLYGYKPFPLPENKKIILFNHRANNTTGWKEVLSIGKYLFNQQNRTDFVIWFTDENSTLKRNDIKGLPYVRVEHVPDESYGYLLDNAAFAICNHKGYSTWNMAVIDAVTAGCPVLLPYDGVYKHMFDSGGWYHNFGGDLTSQIAVGLDLPEESLYHKARVEKLHLHRNMLFLDSVPTSIVRDLEKRIGKTPAKYDQVKHIIDLESPVEKRAWVNELWSFHTNSNFQRIRLKLLSEGYRDNITQEDTIYYA